MISWKYCLIRIQQAQIFLTYNIFDIRLVTSVRRRYKPMIFWKYCLLRIQQAQIFLPCNVFDIKLVTSDRRS